jgi:two-component system chemotaxis response regulator CheY
VMKGLSKIKGVKKRLKTAIRLTMNDSISNSDTTSARKSILAIEDDHSMRQLLDHMLSKEYDVASLSNGNKAMQWLAGGNIPDLIITDIDVEGMNGEEFVTNLKRSGFFRDIPIIILSGKTSERTAFELLAKGAAGMLTKPFSKEALFEMMTKHIA